MAWGPHRLALAAVVAAAGARAADKPVIAPPADWVKPVHVDLEPPKATAGAAVGWILGDTQVRLSPQGEQVYNDVIAKVQTPQGLAALGTFGMAWNPDMDRLVVHKLSILRDGKVIDVLAGGKSFTILRRESRLEQATLDGTLTAALQIEDLQVGDVMEVSWTLEHADPVLAGTMTEVMRPSTKSLAHLRVRIVWPAGAGVRTRVSDWTPPLTVRTAAGAVEASLSIDGLTEAVTPKGAPARFEVGREIEISSFAGWQGVSTLMSPLYEKAARITPGSALAAEADRIAAKTADPKARAEAALALVQDKVRYVLLATNGGGLRPADAELTWERRFGDCKGKTALLLALLKRLGIDAEAALVSTILGDGLDARLPSLTPFDHVFVHARIAGREYWLDGTRSGDRNLNAIRIPPYRWALPVRPSGAELVKLDEPPLATPDSEISVRLDASAGLDVPAKVHAEFVLHGDHAQTTSVLLAQFDPEQLQSFLKGYWRSQYKTFEPGKLAAAYDPAVNEERLTFDGTAKLDWTGTGYEIEGAVLESKPDLEREAGPHRDAPYTLNFPSYDARSETIVLPKGGKGFSVVGDDVDEAVGAVAYSRHAAIKDGVFAMRASVRTLAPEVPAADRLKAASEMTRLSTAALFVAPPGAAAVAERPANLTALLEGGNKALNERQGAEALALFDKALALDPKSARGLGLKSLTEILLGRMEAARTDDDAALASDARDEAALLAKGDLAVHDLRWTVAMVAFTEAADAAPRDATPRQRRLFAWLQSGDLASGLADSEDALKAFPSDQNLHQIRGMFLARLKRSADAAGEAAEIAASDPKNATVQRSAAELLRLADRTAEARSLMDALVARAPSAEAYLAREEFRDPADLDGVEQDARAALKLDPRSRGAMRSLAWVETHHRRFSEAKAWYDRLVAADPANTEDMASRGDVEARLGQSAQARADFDQARRVGADQAQQLNDVCWAEATSNFDLARALSDCDAAIKLAPGAADILDSRAFTLLRLGRDDDAIAQYSAALAQAPELGPSLYGRSLAERRRGRTADADHDRAKALAADPRVIEDFKSYGVTE